MFETYAIVFLILAWMMLILSFFALRVLAKPNKVRNSELSDKKTDPRPDISIIVYPEESLKSLDRLVMDLLSQEYEGKKEVVVCIDESNKEAEALIKMLQLEHGNLFLTFIPENSKNISRRKLAIYLGLKASHYDTIVMTNTLAEISSKQWLDSIGERYVEGIEVVISPAVNTVCKDGIINTGLRSFDSSLDTLTWITASLRGETYRGSSANLSFKKEVFFRNNGFAETLNLHYGEDDRFVKQISSAGNTAVNTSSAGVVRVCFPTSKSLDSRVARRLFTTQGSGGKARRITSILPVATWLNLILGTLGIIFGIGNTYIIVFGAISIIGYWIMVSLMTVHAASFTGLKFKEVSVIPFLLWRPCLTSSRRRKMMANRDSNFTWTKLK